MKNKAVSGKSLARRAFLRGVGLGAVGGAAALAVMPLADEAFAGTEDDKERRKARYNASSADVKNYYRVNRYPPTRR